MSSIFDDLEAKQPEVAIEEKTPSSIFDDLDAPQPEIEIPEEVISSFSRS